MAIIEHDLIHRDSFAKHNVTAPVGEQPAFTTVIPTETEEEIRPSPVITPTSSQPIVMPRGISRRNMLGLFALTAAETVPVIRQMTKDVVRGPYEFERVGQKESDLVNNGLIGISLSAQLPGLIDLKHYDKKDDQWKIYNVVVPNVVAHGLDINAEIFQTPTTIHHGTNDRGDVTFKIACAPFDGVKFVDGQPNLGNGAAFDLFGVIPQGKREVSISFVPREESAPIEKVSLANYFGAVEDVKYLATSDGLRLDTSKFSTPADGNFLPGDFYSYPIDPVGSLSFGGPTSKLVQIQRYKNASELRVETRDDQWRPEFKKKPDKPWIEMVQVWQTLNADNIAEVTFGFEIAA